MFPSVNRTVVGVGYYRIVALPSVASYKKFVFYFKFIINGRLPQVLTDETYDLDLVRTLV